MLKIGYARVSSAAQNLDRQLGALRAERWDAICQEKVTARSLKGRPQLERAIDALGTGDVFVVAAWDRATRSMMDGIAIIDRVLARAATTGLHLLSMDSEDAPPLLAAMAQKPLPDDQLVALFSVLDVYARAGQPAGLMQRIEAAVTGACHLEEALHNFRNPPPPTPEQQSLNDRIRQMDAQDAAERERRRQDREEGIAWLRANVATLTVGDYAREGQILRNIRYLHGQLGKLDKKSGSRWALSQWRRLEAGFGPDVARAFRDHCVAYWRMYRPQLRSEIGRDSQTTPWAVILGLTGLAIEAAEIPAWAANLSPAQAALATRYALWGLNQLPLWFQAVFAAHPESVKQVLQNEIAWELAHPREANAAGYVLSRLRWTSTQLGSDLRDDILELLSNHPTADAATLTEALTIALRNPAPIPPHSQTCSRDVPPTPTMRRSRPFGSPAFFAPMPSALYPRLRTGSPPVRIAPPRRGASATFWATSGVTGFRRFDPQHQSFRRTPILLRLIKLCHAHINPANDIDHAALAEDKGYTPGLRDHAEAARRRLLEILCEMPGPDSYRALVELSEFHTDPYLKDRMRVLAERRAEADTERDPWAPADVDAFAAEAERSPRTQEDFSSLPSRASTT